MRIGPNIGLVSLGCVSLRNTAMRLATVSARGLSRSWGSVSQASSCAMSFGSPPYHDRSAFTVSSASRLEATTRTTGVCSACAAAMAGRNPSGAPTVMIGAMSLPSAMLMPPLTSR